jgi:hypothetical protein
MNHRSPEIGPLCSVKVLQGIHDNTGRRNTEENAQPNSHHPVSRGARFGTKYLGGDVPGVGPLEGSARRLGHGDSSCSSAPVSCEGDLCWLQVSRRSPVQDPARSPLPRLALPFLCSTSGAAAAPAILPWYSIVSGKCLQHFEIDQVSDTLQPTPRFN